MKKIRGESIEILIAEDSPTQAELLRQLLEDHNFTVSIAPNGKAALAQLALLQPALVISDVIMPELDGYGLCKAIKSDEKLKHIPVMLVTTLSDPGDVIRGLECGADNFVRKPYEEKYLISSIDYLLMNVELRKNQRMQVALEIDIGGKKHFINAERQQMLDLLVSTYEQAVQVNGELRQREKELAHSNQVLQELNRISDALNSAVSQHEVAEIALRHAVKLPGVRAGWISLHAGGSSFRLAAACGLPPALKGPDAFDGDCACQRQVMSGEHSSTVNIVQCERLARAQGEGAAQDLCCHASIPLQRRNGQPLGVMNLAGHGNLLFNKIEQEVLHAIGSQVAVALERSMLHDHLEQLVDERTSALTQEIAERKRIQDQQSRLIAIIEATPDLIGTATPDGRVLSLNHAGMRMIGIEERNLPALRIQDVHPEWAGKLVWEEGIPHAISHGAWSGETAILGPNGREIPVLQVILVHKGADGAVEYLSTIARDITQRKASEARVERLNRIYAVLSGINATIIRVRDEDELFTEACRIAVVHGQFNLAWIGRLDSSCRQVAVVAQAGHSNGYVEETYALTCDGLSGSSALITQALTEMKPAICNDIASDARIMALRRDAALGLGYRSVTVVPLRLGGQPFGVFALYSTEPNAFDDEEMKLLTEMSGDISYALDNLRLESRRRQAEDELRKLSLAVEQSPNSIMITDLDAKIEYVNRGFVAVTGYGREEVIGRKPDFLHSGKTSSETYQTMWAHLLRGEAWRDEVINRRKDGSEYVESKFVSPVRDADGRVTHYLAIGRDTTERRRAEEALRSSREHLDRILNSMAEGAYGVDLQGNCTFVNRAFLQILGYQDESELLGRNVHELIHHSHADGRPYPANECRLYQAFQIHQPINVSDEVFWRKDGVAIPVEYWSHPIVIDGEVQGAIATFVDITERKQAEESLLLLNESLEQRVVDRTLELERARREADDASRAKSAFLSTMSHEIRTPMNGVVGMVEVLARSRLSEHQADLVRTINDSAHTLLNIIDDILDFSKIEAGRLELERVPVSIMDLVEGLCNSLLPVADRKGVALSTFVSPDIPELVLSDDTRLRQVLYNLTGNAIKFAHQSTGKQGQVSVRVEMVQANPLRLALHVIDNGIGMTAETVSRLFTPFTQAEVSTTRRFGGTGLGLAICKRLVDLLGGEISVTSTPDVGSTFTVTLPFEVPAVQPKRSLPDLTGVECIVLDGPHIHVDDLRTYLEHAGATVHVAADVAGVLTKAERLPAPVTLILHAVHGEIPEEMFASFAVIPDARFLLITHGRRRRARTEGSNTISLDGDAMRRLALLRAVAVAAGRASPEIFHEQPEQTYFTEISPPTVEEARSQGNLILVVDDDEINCKVILQQLSLLGYAAEVTTNGVEALKSWRSGQYALLLTDLHMPEMDGYTLAATIRQEENEHEKGRIPIVVLTANALRGEASRALALGVDDYLTKPVQLERLKTALETWMPSARPVQSSGKEPAPVNASGETVAAVDITVLQKLIGSDSAIVHEFLADYLKSARRLAGEIRVAFADGDLKRVGAMAHRLKSTSRSVGALSLGELSAKLEDLCEENDLPAVTQEMVQFESSLAQVEKQISTLLENK